MLHRTIEQIMRGQRLCTLPPEATVSEAADAMAKRHVAAVLVMVGDELTGIFTERDVIVRVLAARSDPTTTRLAEVMSPHPVTLDSSATIRQALAEMHDSQLRHLPIVRDGRVVGVVSMRDFVGDEIAELDREDVFEGHVWEELR